VGHGLGDVGDVAHLGGQVARHEVDAVGQVFPGPRDPADVRLPAELAFGADLAGDAGDLRGEGVGRASRRDDGVLQLQDLPVDVVRDLLRQVSGRDRRRDVGDVAHLGGQVARHQVDVVGQVLPRTGYAFDLGLPAELAFGADLAGDAGDLRGEGRELVHHRVDRVLQLQDLALDVDRDLLRQVSGRDRRRDLGDVAAFRGHVARHQVDVVGQVLPRAGDAFDLRLAAELAFRADLARDARDLRGERRELVDHRVDGFRGAQELSLERAAADLERHGLRQVAFRDGADDARGLARGMDEFADERVDAADGFRPRSPDVPDVGAFGDSAFLADDPPEPRELAAH